MLFRSYLFIACIVVGIILVVARKEFFSIITTVIAAVLTVVSVFAAMWALDKKYNVRFQTTVGDIEDKIDLRHEEIRKKREAKKAERKAKKSL